MLIVSALDKKYTIYEQFTRDIIIDEVDDNYFIFKGNKSYEYTIFYKYIHGSNDDLQLTMTAEISFDGIEYYDLRIYNRQVKDGVMLDTPYPLVIQIPQTTDTVTGYYILTVPAVVEFCKININGLVDGDMYITIGATK